MRPPTRALSLVSTASKREGDALAARETSRVYAQPGAVAAVRAFEAAVGGRVKLIEAMLQAPPSSALDYVVGLIADPREDATDLAVLCARGGVTLGELLEAFKQGTYAKMAVLSVYRLAQAAPAAVDDLATRSAPYDETCRACNGTGSLAPTTPDARPTPCETCNALGTIRQLPELERQKLFFEMTKLVSKGGGGITTNVGVNVAQAAPLVPSQAYDRLITAVDRILYGKGVEDAALEDDAAGVIEAETLPAEADMTEAPDASNRNLTCDTTTAPSASLSSSESLP
jgi:hypothetical protein